MKKNGRNSYDAIIIGAGIGGLVCGCYLAKRGMKVLVSEQNKKTGGYCTSFKRRGLTFDAAPHCFGSYRDNGITRHIFSDLGIDKLMDVIRPDPTDILVTPDHTLYFWNDLEKTIDNFCSIFPEDKDNISQFFHFILNLDPISSPRLSKISFRSLLDEHFTNNRIKDILSLPLLGLGGLPSSLISAFVGAKLYSEFYFDGGYYPKGGMQVIPEKLTNKIKDYGGEVKVSCQIKRISIADGKVTGVFTDSSDFIPSKYVISGCDSRQTFLDLIGKDLIEPEFYLSLGEMAPSLSNFIIYLGLNNSIKSDLMPGTTYSVFTKYDSEKLYAAAKNNDIREYNGFMIRISHDKSVIIAMMPASFSNMAFWEKNKYNYQDILIENIEKYSIPHLSEHIIYKDAATPQTLYKYTSNYKGASFGWAGTPEQFCVPQMRKPPLIHGLYLAGHWTTLGVGISGAAYVGYDTAKLILRKEKI